MEWVETTGRTIDAALDAALDELGVDEADVEYEVLAQPRKGLLGRIGGGEARVRARVKPLSREKPGERRRRPRRSNRGAGGERKAGAEKQQNGAGQERKREPAGDGAARARAGSNRGRRRRRGAGGSSERTTQKQGATVDEERAVPIDEQAEQAEAFTHGLVDAFGADAGVTAKVEDDDNVQVEVVGEDLGLLVGPKGATLAAIEELVRTVVQRQTGGHSARIHVDVGGYRAKRREALAEFTRELAERVRADGTEQALEPMMAADRKVVHDVVAEIDGVDTISEGEEPRRRVVIRRT